MQTRLRWFLLAITPLALLSVGLAQEKQPSFSLTISAPQTVKAGASVPSNITVKNISSSPIIFDFARAVAFDFLFNVQNSEGKEPAETHQYQLIQGKDPHTFVHATSYIQKRLAPGETLKINMDITELFDFKPGTYTIQLSRPWDSPPNLWEPKPAGPFVTSNIVSLTVTP